jgi:hypothetical protein
VLTVTRQWIYPGAMSSVVPQRDGSGDDVLATFEYDYDAIFE